MFLKAIKNICGVIYAMKLQVFGFLIATIKVFLLTKHAVDSSEFPLTQLILSNTLKTGISLFHVEWDDL